MLNRGHGSGLLHFKSLQWIKQGPNHLSIKEGTFRGVRVLVAGIASLLTAPALSPAPVECAGAGKSHLFYCRPGSWLQACRGPVANSLLRFILLIQVVPLVIVILPWYLLHPIPAAMHRESHKPPIRWQLHGPKGTPK